MTYRTPTPDEFRDWLRSRGITGRLAAKWARLGSDRQVRKYTDGTRHVSYPLFFTIAAHHLFASEGRYQSRLDEVSALTDQDCKTDTATLWSTRFTITAAILFSDNMHDLVAWEMEALAQDHPSNKNQSQRP